MQLQRIVKLEAFIRLQAVMSDSLTSHYAAELDSIRGQGLFKSERIITSPQSAEIELADGRKVLNFCANNYLGLADHPRIIQWYV